MTKPFDHDEVAADQAATSGGVPAEASADGAVNTEAVNDDPQTGMPSASDGTNVGSGAGSASDASSEEHPDTALAAQRLDDLQRLNAEYVNYKRRVDRLRADDQERAVRDVLESILPVLDDIQGARDHGDLTDGPFAAIAEKLETTLGKYGLVRYGAKGEPFDPAVHEALMHQAWPEGDPALDGAEGSTVVLVLQPGFKAGDVVLRPARVAVADAE